MLSLTTRLFSTATTTTRRAIATSLPRPFLNAATITRRTLVARHQQLHTSSPKMVVHEMQSQEDYEEVLKKRAVVIDAVAEWCQPCKMVAPQFLKFSEDPKNEGIHFTKFDIDEMPEVAEGFEITIMPTFVYLIDGKVVEKVEGLNLPKLNRTTAEFSERVRAMAAAAASSENGAESNGHDATGENGNGLEKDKDMPVLETDREDW